MQYRPKNISPSHICFNSKYTGYWTIDFSFNKTAFIHKNSNLRKINQIYVLWIKLSLKKYKDDTLLTDIYNVMFMP